MFFDGQHKRNMVSRRKKSVNVSGFIFVDGQHKRNIVSRRKKTSAHFVQKLAFFIENRPMFLPFTGFFRFNTCTPLLL
jgi:hypothetical protein